MKKNVFFLFSIIVIGLLLVGCSSKTEDELVAVQNDMKENVGDTLIDIEEKLDEKVEEVDAGALSPEEFNSYYDEEIQPRIDKAKNYMADYEQPTTDDGKEYFTVLTDGLTLGLEMLEKFAELITALTDETTTEEDLHQFSSEIDDIMEDLEEQEQEAQNLREQYEEDYNVEFESIDFE